MYPYAGLNGDETENIVSPAGNCSTTIAEGIRAAARVRCLPASRRSRGRRSRRPRCYGASLARHACMSRRCRHHGRASGGRHPREAARPLGRDHVAADVQAKVPNTASAILWNGPAVEGLLGRHRRAVARGRSGGPASGARRSTGSACGTSATSRSARPSWTRSRPLSRRTGARLRGALAREAGDVDRARDRRRGPIPGVDQARAPARCVPAFQAGQGVAGVRRRDGIPIALIQGVEPADPA
jgi:hypothetical protein